MRCRDSPLHLVRERVLFLLTQGATPEILLPVSLRRRMGSHAAHDSAQSDQKPTERVAHKGKVQSAKEAAQSLNETTRKDAMR